MTLDVLPAPLQVNTVLTAAATLLGIYTCPHPVLPPPPIPPAKVHLSVEQQGSVRGICETRTWRVHAIAPSATSTQLVVNALPADAPARRGGNLRNSCTQFPLKTVIQLLKEARVDLPADASAITNGKPQEVAAPDADNLDLVNMPATFDYEGIRHHGARACRQEKWDRNCVSLRCLKVTVTAVLPLTWRASGWI